MTPAERPWAPLLAAAVLFLAAVAGILAFRDTPALRGQFDARGYGVFANDALRYREDAARLAGHLRRGDLAGWLTDGGAFQVKVHSVGLALCAPLLGDSILALAPLNLACFLLFLVLLRELAGLLGPEAARRAPWIALLFPSVLLHCTQMLREPLLLPGVLALALVLARCLRAEAPAPGWREPVAGVTAAAWVMLVKPSFWPLVLFLQVLALAFAVIGRGRGRAALAATCLASALLVPLVPPDNDLPVTRELVEREPWRGSPLGRPLAMHRLAFSLCERSGSSVDREVLFHDDAEVLRYLPRAAQVGLFAPFPSQWCERGRNTGLAGRLVSGWEMCLACVLLALAVRGQLRRGVPAPARFLFLAFLAGTVALGLVLSNAGALYRMRYPFWALLIALGAAAGKPMTRCACSAGKTIFFATDHTDEHG